MAQSFGAPPVWDAGVPEFEPQGLAQWLAHSPPTKAIRVRSAAGSLPDFRMWESCWTTPLAGRVFSGCFRYPRPCIPAPLHPRVSFHVMFRDDGTYGSQLESPSLGGRCLALGPPPYAFTRDSGGRRRPINNSPPGSEKSASTAKKRVRRNSRGERKEEEEDEEEEGATKQAGHVLDIIRTGGEDAENAFSKGS
ncbi:hypothetical protein PR048_000195 [Dryococelus australis]|uniref:Uncharacterized protein n=1 Tax=Dryococelus australis TaxID=614101 RepID=A0ABQ9IDY7_9NEOP|nr:hypothetical protein PR048_000195 [Dryococelus australis]